MATRPSRPRGLSPTPRPVRARPPELADDRRSQADRHPVLLHRAHLLPGRRARGAADPRPAGGPNGTLVSAERYNQLFTMHGTTMIFLVDHAAGAAFFNYMIPLQIGARDVPSRDSTRSATGSSSSARSSSTRASRRRGARRRLVRLTPTDAGRTRPGRTLTSGSSACRSSASSLRPASTSS